MKHNDDLKQLIFESELKLLSEGDRLDKIMGAVKKGAITTAMALSMLTSMQSQASTPEIKDDVNSAIEMVQSGNEDQIDFSSLSRGEILEFVKNTPAHDIGIIIREHFRGMILNGIHSGEKTPDEYIFNIEKMLKSDKTTNAFLNGYSDNTGVLIIQMAVQYFYSNPTRFHIADGIITRGVSRNSSDDNQGLSTDAKPKVVTPAKIDPKIGDNVENLKSVTNQVLQGYIMNTTSSLIARIIRDNYDGIITNGDHAASYTQKAWKDQLNVIGNSDDNLIVLRNKGGVSPLLIKMLFSYIHSHSYDFNVIDGNITQISKSYKVGPPIGPTNDTTPDINESNTITKLILTESQVKMLMSKNFRK